MLGACNSTGKEPLDRNLPPPPRFSQPSLVPDPKPGESAIAIAARERAARKRANAVIAGWNGWYGNLQKQYRRK